MKRRILLIEDAPQVAGILTAKLAREGHSIDWVRGRSEAYPVLSKTDIDLILLSSDLSAKEDAWELLGELRAKPSAPAVVMLLETEEMHLESKARAEGAAAVIQKPFKPTLVAKLILGLPAPTRTA